MINELNNINSCWRLDKFNYLNYNNPNSSIYKFDLIDEIKPNKYKGRKIWVIGQGDVMRRKELMADIAV